ncbi:CRISPR-associated endonuclease Cas1 [Saccharopolyspora sp. K220]|uniref:CRISPR-associated endonuclease Cas4g/Cas1g n=1 Tax=Saccharopolyspora soli TaxID=2926618 RepID=UPI001F576D69|nr:CRISPR-associated endonuclease Cas1 [Saccharopolyspora soli]MCI2423625.1 CRISPR-associated endonuclease Cas1 [Saccharopolyspora soli]
MDDPLPLGARAVGDIRFCERLFHLQYAEGYRLDSEEMRLGRHVHSSVDIPTGQKRPAQRIKPANWKIRSLALSSAERGLWATCDVVEAVDGSVHPVEFRRGAPQRDGSPWPDQHVQLMAQIVLLRQHGYECTEGYLWYDSVRQRVRVPWTAEAETELRRAIDDALKLVGQPKPPPPLRHSQKCVLCAMLPICMPDEINELAERNTKKPRRLLPRAPARDPIYIAEPGSTVSVRSDRLVVSKGEDKLLSVRLRDVLHLVVSGPVTVTSQAVHALADQGSPLVWTSTHGSLKAVGVPTLGNHVELRRRQFTAHPDQMFDIARRMVSGKIRNCRTLLRRNPHLKDQDLLDRLDAEAARAQRAPTLSTLLGIEGAAARTYFNGFARSLRNDHRLPGPSFEVSGRTHRPPEDAVSCLLSFLYGLLVKDVMTACYALGLDPYYGCYHQPHRGRPALVLDLAEEFRPLIADSTAFTLINNRQARPATFHVHPVSVALTKTGRREVIDAYEHRLATEIRHPVFEYQVTYRRAIEIQARLFAACLLGEISHYTAFTSR